MRALWRGSTHGHEPLVGEQGLDDRLGAIAPRHHEFVGFDRDQAAQGLEVGQDALASLVAIEPLVSRGPVLVDGRLGREDIQ